MENNTIKLKCPNKEEIPVIYRGTTPTVILELGNIESEALANVIVCHLTMENDSGKNQIVFDSPTIDAENKTISVELTQQDTRTFDYGYLNVQARMKLQNGRIYPTEIVQMIVKKCLEETIL